VPLVGVIQHLSRTAAQLCGWLSFLKRPRLKWTLKSKDFIQIFLQTTSLASLAGAFEGEKKCPSVYESTDEKHDNVSFTAELWQLLRREALNVKLDSSATKICCSTVILGGTLVAIHLNNIARNDLDSAISLLSHVGSLFLLSTFVTSIHMLIDLNDFVEALRSCVHKGAQHQPLSAVDTCLGPLWF
jgi:hypothetical protein